MGAFYLSKRKQKDGSIRLYAVSQKWDPERKKQVKDQQIYIGCKRADGTYKFNDNTEQFQYLLRGTEYERPFYNWSDFIKSQRKQSSGEIEDCNEEPVKKATILDGGIELLLGHVANKIGLTKHLTKTFGECNTDLILSLAYYCASQSRQPLYAASDWSLHTKLPGLNQDFDEFISQRDISHLLSTITPGLITSFLGDWMKRFPRENRLSLDITSVSSYSKKITEVTDGFNRDQEDLAQINVLMMVDQESMLPVWFEELPGAIADITTIKDTVALLSKIDNSPRAVVCDRGFASHENIKCLQEHKFKFTMGIPLYRFSDVRDEIAKAKENAEFHRPGITYDLFESYDNYPTQCVTRKIKWNGHRVYLHLYYTAAYKTESHNELMERVNFIQNFLERGKQITELKNEYDKMIAQKCFTVKSTPKRGIKVTCNQQEVAKLEEETGGYFAIASNQIKDPFHALYVYKLRDGVEKRFDDLKNEEDCHRLRMHSSAHVQARLFIQFIAQILRCYLLHEKKSRESDWARLKLGNKTINDIMRAMSYIRYVHVEGRCAFYKRPTATQIALMSFFEIDTSSKRKWPSLH